MKAFMSCSSLMVNNANFGFEGKLATLWFDNLMLEMKKDIVKNAIEFVAEQEHWSNDTLKQMRKIQISSEDVLPDVSFIDESVIEDDYYKIATDIVKKKYNELLSNHKTYGGAMHEITSGGFGIANTVKYWTLLNAKESCIFLPMDIEQQMIKRVFGCNPNDEFNNFSNIMTAMIPDLTEYSWDEIIEIRNHSYWTQFRKKLTELNKSVGDKKLEKEILDEIVNKNLVEIAQHFRPHIVTNIVKGVACNVPLSIPINPLSVVCTGYDIIKEIDFEKNMVGYIFT